MRVFTATLLALFCLITLSEAQPVDLSQIWPAHWIGHPEGPHREYAVFHFRKSFELEAVPDTLVVHSSGDNRYQLYVNGQLVTWGPQRGDLRHWFYESTNIAPHLKPGGNVIVATVINYGSHPPDAQLTVQTAFLLCADRSEYKFLNTNASWAVNHNEAYAPNIVDNTQVRGY